MRRRIAGGQESWRRAGEMEGREGGKEGGLMSGHPAARAGLQPPKLRSSRLRHDGRLKGDGSVRSDKGKEGGREEP